MIENITPILRVESLAASLTYYQDVLGFKTDWTHDDNFGSVSRDGHTILLCEGHQGQPGTWLWIGVHDLDRMYEGCKSHGAKIRSEILSRPWAREFHVEDPDGHVLRFGGEPEE